MSYTNGRLYMCDRCKKLHFCACIGEGERDGGFTRWNKFEPLPEGWRSPLDTGLLCPECVKQYQQMLDEFLKKTEKSMEVADENV